MKSIPPLILGALLVTSLGAQSPPSPTPTPTPHPPTGPLSQAALDKIEKMTPIFAGKTLDGWTQAPLYPTTLSGGDVNDLPVFMKKLSQKTDAVSAFINEQLDEAVRASLATYSPESEDAKSVRNAFFKSLNAIVTGPSIYDKARFQGVTLRPETKELSEKNPQGLELARLNRLLLEDAFPAELPKSPDSAWTVKDGAMSSLGAGRGVIYTKDEYNKYRLVFTMRHLGGPPSDHAPCVLIFGATPPPGEKGLDALGGIQFQPPNGGSWDYRPGKNNNGKDLFTRIVNPRFNSREWHQVELLVDAETGTARMAVSQPVGTKAVEVLTFNDPSAGKKGPIAWQMHNKGLFDEFKDVRIEENPAEDRLITTD
jgi:hypothetical protein